MTEDIDVSFVMTVYNKEYYLPAVIHALLKQTGLKNPEYIFIDDVSTDNSVEIIRKMTTEIKNVTIITNSHNRGISARINQGIFLAKGQWTRMLDSDDIFPLDSTQKMLEIAKKTGAEMIYGCFTKTGKEPQELEDCYLEEFTYNYTPNALEGVLNGKFTRMGQLIKTDILQKAKGADERAFIQDESIPLRTALYAQGVVKMTANVVLVPKEIGNFSGNKIQLDHDRFMAYYWFLVDHPELSPKIQRKIYLRIVSAYWKFIKKSQKFPYFSKCFIYYIECKIRHPLPNKKYLDKMYKDFSSLTSIRRIKP